jgi:hypothetical protein
VGASLCAPNSIALYARRSITNKRRNQCATSFSSGKSSSYAVIAADLPWLRAAHRVSLAEKNVPPKKRRHTGGNKPTQRIERTDKTMGKWIVILLATLAVVWGVSVYVPGVAHPAFWVGGHAITYTMLLFVGIALGCFFLVKKGR